MVRYYLRYYPLQASGTPPPQTTTSGASKKTRKKERVDFSGSTIGLDLSPAAGRIKGSPRYCRIAHHLARLRIHYFLPTSRAPEEQRQSRRNHSGGKLGGKRGIGDIGQYISPRSTLRCVQLAPYVKQIDSV